ncbi:MAG: two pore domain potassium channel family protein [Candidatus Omnitrophica bacterium]|nr:two pore domain potassium channel family protein [Candidatus Omnitrophota bacterium]
MSHKIVERANKLERDAHRLMEEKKVSEAFRSFDEAAHIYSKAGEHLPAAICFASAASCWNIHTGWQPLKNAASRSLFAAREALKARQFSYARELFRDASLLYEKEGDAEKYSECFVGAQDSHLHHLWEIFFSGRNRIGIQGLEEPVSRVKRMEALLKAVLGALSWLIWGYGEKPMRTLLSVIGVIVITALLYQFSGQIQASDSIRSVNFQEALYFSTVTFATVGYGDYLPVGWVRTVAVFEALTGIFLMPLFLIALTRRYLRIERS